MGNKIGWIIAGALVLLIAAAAILKFVVFPSHAKPTHITLKEGFLDKAEMTINPSEVIGRSISGTGNAGDDYDRAIKLFAENARAFRRAMNRAEHTREIDLDSDVLTPLENVARHVALGAQKEEMHYTFVHTPEEFIVGWFYKPVDRIEELMQALHLLVTYYERQKEYAKAAKVTESMLVMGWHMVNERSRPFMLQVGADWQKYAIEALRDYYKKMGDQYKSRTPAIEEYGRQLSVMVSAFNEKRTAVFNLDSKKMHPGDIYNVAENDKDRAWRVQAILWLGVLRHTHSNHRGDMKYIDKLIEKYLDSSDPLEVAAAKAARDMTDADFNQISTR